MRRGHWLILLLLLAAPGYAARLVAVATIQPYASLLAEVLGKGWEVRTLIPPGAVQELYTPKPSDVQKLIGARLVVANGLSLDDWLIERLVKPNAPRARILYAGKLLKDTILPMPNGEGDPHLWTDPKRMATLVLAFGRVAAELDPQNAPVYRARAERTKARLLELADRTQALIKKAPRRDLIAYKNPFTYLAERYGLTIRFLIGKTPTSEPTPREIASAGALEKRYGFLPLVAPLQFAPEARKFANVLNTRLVALDLVGSESPDYFATWERNALKLAEGLGAP